MASSSGRYGAVVARGPAAECRLYISLLAVVCILYAMGLLCGGARAQAHHLARLALAYAAFTMGAAWLLKRAALSGRLFFVPVQPHCAAEDCRSGCGCAGWLMTAITAACLIFTSDTGRCIKSVKEKSRARS